MRLFLFYWVLITLYYMFFDGQGADAAEGHLWMVPRTSRLLVLPIYNCHTRSVLITNHRVHYPIVYLQSPGSKVHDIIKKFNWKEISRIHI